VSQDGFEQVNKNPREWISREAKRAQVEAVVDDINQVLREGVQYFTLSQGASKDSFEAADRVSRSGGLSRDFIAKLIAHPKSPCIWENEKDGIGLDSKLAERVDELRLRYVAEILGENPSPYDIKEWAQQWSRSGSTEKMKGVSMEESVTSSQLRFDGNLNHEKRMLLKAAVSKLQDVKEQEIGVISKSKVNSWRERRLSLVECEETNPSAHGQTHPRK
jgi:hypothetical protein